MKSIFILTIIISLGLFSSCKKDEANINAPECIKQRISDQDNSNKACPDLDDRVIRYLFQGQTVYLLEFGACLADGGFEVVDSKCNSLGWLGGITGNKIINGVNFHENATSEKIIWRN